MGGKKEKGKGSCPTSSPCHKCEYHEWQLESFLFALFLSLRLFFITEIPRGFIFLSTDFFKAPQRQLVIHIDFRTRVSRFIHRIKIKSMCISCTWSEKKVFYEVSSYYFSFLERLFHHIVTFRTIWRLVYFQIILIKKFLFICGALLYPQSFIMKVSL